MSRRKPLEREAIVQAIDAQIMGLLAIKAMVLSVDDHDDEDAIGALGPQGPCPDRQMREPHDVVWVQSFGSAKETGMCRHCGGEWTVEPDESPGVSSPDPA